MWKDEGGKQECGWRSAEHALTPGPSPRAPCTHGRGRGVRRAHPAPSPQGKGRKGKIIDPRVCAGATAAATPWEQKNSGRANCPFVASRAYYDVEGLPPIKELPRDRDPPFAESGDDCGAAVPAAQKVGAQDGRRPRPHHKHGGEPKRWVTLTDRRGGTEMEQAPRKRNKMGQKAGKTGQYGTAAYPSSSLESTLQGV